LYVKQNVVEDYYTGDYKLSLNLYSFNVNIIAWIKNRKGAPPLDTFSAIKWAKQAGFNSVNIPMYYVIGYEGETMPSNTTEVIRAFVAQVRKTAEEEGLKISGTGIGNNFANSDPTRVELEVRRALFWIDMAAEMGAPFIRVFSGIVPDDLEAAGGWTAVAKERVVPALKTITAYAETRGVKIGMQNHGDMTSTADQTIQMMQWVNNPNIFLIDDTGYFRLFLAPDGLNYDWYSDINKVLPFCGDFQAKRKPAGAEQTVMMDYIRLFSGLRRSSFREDINLERLWFKEDPDNPKDQPTPPYEQVAEFLTEVKAALAATKKPPV